MSSIVFSNKLNSLVLRAKLLSLLEVILQTAGKELEGGVVVYYMSHCCRCSEHCREGSLKIERCLFFFCDPDVTTTIQMSYRAESTSLPEEIWRVVPDMPPSRVILPGSFHGSAKD